MLPLYNNNRTPTIKGAEFRALSITTLYVLLSIKILCLIRLSNQVVLDDILMM